MVDERVTGVVLAGGRARRMGGADKGLLLLDGEPLARRAAVRLAAQVGRVFVNANRHGEVYGAWGFPVVADVLDGFVGPLAGVHAVMTVAECEWVVSVPCDTPRFPVDLAARLLDAAEGQGAAGAVARAGGRMQPVFLLARTGLADDLAGFLRTESKVDRWTALQGFVTVDFSDVTAFDNINSPADLAAAAGR